MAARSAARTERPERDLRPTVKPELVEDMLVAASDGAHSAFTSATKGQTEPRFPDPTAWKAIRQSVHTLTDAERRAVVLRLVGEEAGRIRRDRGASMSEHGAISIRRRESD
jgi:hypothetical protein